MVKIYVRTLQINYRMYAAAVAQPVRHVNIVKVHTA